MNIHRFIRAWEAVRRAVHGTEPRVIKSGGSYGFPSEIELPNAVSVVFGLNGAGKSRFLRSIAQHNERSHFFAIYDLALYLKNEFGRRDDIDSFKEETDPQVLTAEVATAVQRLVRRQYDAIRWFTVEIDGSPFSGLVDEEIVPLFEVDYAGATYDFRTMGMGELSAHLITWLFEYGRDLEPRLILMDEPEAFLPAPMKAALLEHVLTSCARNKWEVVIASHSLEFIEPALKAGAALFINERENAAQLLPTSVQLADTVRGIYGPTSGDRTLVFVEDEAAMVFTRELIATVQPGLQVEFAFLWCGGFGNLRDVWQHLPCPPVRLPDLKRLLFVADGDKKDEVAKAKGKPSNQARWPLFCLPGDPDRIFESAVLGDLDRLADELGLPNEVLEGLLLRLRGEEHHAWTQGVVDEAPVARQVALRALSRAAVRQLQESNKESLDDFGRNITD